MSLTLVFSCMFGGKTSFLLHIIDTSSYACNVLYINHSLDNRSEGRVYSTHASIEKKGLENRLGVDMIQVSSLSEIDVTKYGVICVDEAQFFSDILVVTKWVDQLKKDVYVAGLSGDYKRENFGQTHKLLPMADRVKILKDTFCSMCVVKGKKKKALFTEKISGNDLQIEIGSQQYLPVCRECYLKFGSIKE